MSAASAKRPIGRRSVLWVVIPLVLAGIALAAASVGSGGAATTTASAQQREIARLRAEVANLRRDAHFWQQLSSTFRPAKSMDLNSMADHQMLVLPGGLVMALHFDNMNLAKAKNLNWVAMAVPGTFTRADQARVNRLYGPGFTHFHDFKNDVHAGRVGTKGVWFVHVGARDFRSPFGKVQKGKVDPNFMPTRPRR
jgi:hypothetical protein